MFVIEELYCVILYFRTQMCIIHGVKILTMTLAEVSLEVSCLLRKHQVIVLSVGLPPGPNLPVDVDTISVSPSAGIASTLLNGV